MPSKKRSVPSLAGSLHVQSYRSGTRPRHQKIHHHYILPLYDLAAKHKTALALTTAAVTAAALTKHNRPEYIDGILPAKWHSQRSINKWANQATNAANLMAKRQQAVHVALLKAMEQLGVPPAMRASAKAVLDQHPDFALSLVIRFAKHTGFPERTTKAWLDRFATMDPQQIYDTVMSLAGINVVV